ncbi:hypothetical protein COU96_01115 [Candidatus Shapirobacteria bacterium CG10_big_fil_rev_8_21_14_0_10_38_14]|uniref:Four helix bundle protein n=1 Tax=Candidatus Shapirobacteria bacterium CG10_big_fil_rev_8_21_14_0_10_38_14 TaxID=1974483 RepID=A0A2M8L5Q9_9BACT|nr:MAG: hypothetical protein COU96_01115 [Candidatus Shapirobacteria bacterium CG10_big_fil_rev_8_21_14_0_10_38_14]
MKNNSIKNERIFDIHKRIYNFVIRVINLTKALPKNTQNKPLIDQIIRSASSMGANDQEADGSITKKEFVHSYNVVRREGKETLYWLSLIADTNPNFASRMEKLRQECGEIIKIVSTIITKTRKNNQ